MKRILGWKREDTEGVEYAEVEFDPVRLSGVVILTDEGQPCVVTYRVTCDSAGITKTAVVRLRRSGGVSTRRLIRRGDGSWMVDKRLIPGLAGLADVDISVTPATNTLPIRRLSLAVGERREVTAAWLRFPSFDVVPLRQAYRRISAMTYEYEAPDLDFRSRLTVDDAGVVQRYGGLWSRLPA